VNKISDYPLLYVIILNWNHKDDLIETIESFITQDYPNFKIVVSDNGSADGSVDYVNIHYKDIKVIENNENLGWAAGNNIGIKYALENKADLILLSNNDIELSNGKLLSDLILSFQNVSNCLKLGVFGCRENYFSLRTITYNSGWDMYPKAYKKTKIFNIFKESSPALGNRYKTVDFVSGSFILINPKLFSQIGYFDENYFMYAEETDYCLRAWSKGYASVIDKELVVFHKVAASSSNNSGFKVYYQTRNLYYLLKKNKLLIKDYNYFMRDYYFGIIKNTLRILISPTESKRKMKLKSMFKALYDAVIKKQYGYTFK